MTVIPMVIGALGTIPKDLVRGLEELEIGEKAETIQTQHWLGWLEYWEVSWRLAAAWSPSSERPSANAGMKKSQGIIQ